MEISDYFYVYAKYLRETGADGTTVQQARDAGSKAEICEKYFSDKSFKARLADFVVRQTTS